jgi:hypothetical protein
MACCLHSSLDRLHCCSLHGVLLVLGVYFTFIAASPTRSRSAGAARDRVHSLCLLGHGWGSAVWTLGLGSSGSGCSSLPGAGFGYYCLFVLWDPGGGGVLQLFHVCILWLEFIPQQQTKLGRLWGHCCTYCRARSRCWWGWSLSSQPHPTSHSVSIILAYLVSHRVPIQVLQLSYHQ